LAWKFLIVNETAMVPIICGIALFFYLLCQHYSNSITESKEIAFLNFIS